MIALEGVCQPDFEVELAVITKKDKWISKFRRLTANLQDVARQKADLAQVTIGVKLKTSQNRTN